MSRFTATFDTARHRLVVAALCSASLVIACLIFSAAPSEAAVPVVVRAEHPRVLVQNAQTFTDLLTKATSDPASERLRSQVINSANYGLTQPVISHDFNGPKQMSEMAKVFVDRTFALAMSWRLTNDTRYADRLWQDLQAAANFAHWNPESMLDTAEIAAAMGIGYDWCYQRWTTAQRATIRAAIVDKALRPGLDDYNRTSTDPEFWVNATHNRNVVVNGGLGTASLAVASEDSTGIAQQVLDKSLVSIRNGLSGFQPDGSYPEGPMYWEYAADFATTYLNALQTASGSTHGLMEVGGFAKSGHFVRNMMTPNGEYYTFGDSDIQIFPAMGLSGLARLTGDTSLDALAASMETSRRAPVRLLWRFPAVPPLSAQAQSVPPSSTYSDSGVTTMRGDTTDSGAAFAALRWGNDPTVGHRHVDSGDVMIAAGGITWATPLGLDRKSYAAQAGGGAVSARWNYYRNRAEGHNTVLLNRDDQSDFRDSPGGTLESTGSGGLGTYAVADLSGAYGAEPGTWKRGVRVLSSERQVVLQDEIHVAAGTVSRWAIHTAAQIELLDGGRRAVFYRDGQRLLVTLHSPGMTFAKSPPIPSSISPAPDQEANEGISKLIVDVPGGSARTVTVSFTFLSGNAPLPSVAMPTPSLSTWADWNQQPAQITSITIDGTQLAGVAADRRSYSVTRDPSLPSPIIAARNSAGQSVGVQELAYSPQTFLIGQTAGSPDTGVLIAFVPTTTSIVAASASSTTRGTPGAVFDGNQSTGWATSGSQYIDLTLRGAVPIHRIDLLWTANETRRIDYRILVRDGTNWTPIQTSSFQSISGWSSHTFDVPMTSNQVRIEVSGDPAGSRTSTIREAVIYGFGGFEAPTGLDSGAWGVNMSQIDSSIAVGEFATVVGSGTGGAVNATFEIVSNNREVVRPVDGGFVGVAPGQARVGVIARVNGWVYPSRPVDVTVGPSSELVLTAAADTFVEGGASASTNYGKANRIDSKPVLPSSPADGTRVRTGLVRFDLSTIDPARVASAVLVMDGIIADGGAGSASRVDAYRVTAPWHETGVTYANRPALGAPIGSAVVTRDRSEVKWDLTSVVKGMSQSELNGFSIGLGGSKSQDSPLMARFDSIESGHPPRVEIRMSSAPLAISASAATGTLRGTAAATHDGSTSTGWAARGGAAITWTLGAPTLVKTLRAQWTPDGSGAVTYRVLVSSDGTRWRDAGTYTYRGGASAYTQDLQYAHEASYLRIQLVSSSPTWQATLREVTWLSPGSVAATLPPALFADVQVSAPAELAVGQAASLTTTVRSITGSPVPTAAVSYASSDPGVIKVDDSGRIFALAPGTAQLRTTVAQSGLSQTVSLSISSTLPNIVTKIASEDTYVEGGASSSIVFGDKPRLDVKPKSPASPADGTRVRDTLLAFDLAAVDPKTVKSAILRLRGAVIDAPTITSTKINIYEAPAGWSESQTTFANRPTLGKIVKSFTVTRTETTHAIDLTEFVKSRTSAQLARLSIGLGGEVATNPESVLVRFSSRETGLSVAPTMTIERSVQGVTLGNAVASRTVRGSSSATIDGNESTGWATTGDQSIRWTLAERETTGSARIHWTANTSGITKFELWGSTDGSTWFEIYRGAHSGASGLQLVPFSRPTPVTHLRMDVHGNPAGNRDSTLREIIVMRDGSVG